MDISKKRLWIDHVPGPQGVRGRRSDNTLIEQTLQWKPSLPLQIGLEKTYHWIARQVKNSFDFELQNQSREKNISMSQKQT